MIEQIREKLNQTFKPTLLEIFNDSSLHRVPANSETHFRVFLVSSAFDGLNAVKRQRLVYDCLKLELNSGVHALSLKTQTVSEYQAAESQAQQAMVCAHNKGAK
jgi:BolA protein